MPKRKRKDGDIGYEQESSAARQLYSKILDICLRDECCNHAEEQKILRNTYVINPNDTYEIERKMYKTLNAASSFSQELMSFYLDRILCLVVGGEEWCKCSMYIIIRLLNLGANPNVVAGDFSRGLSAMQTAKIVCGLDGFDPQIFYWLVLYGGEVYKWIEIIIPDIERDWFCCDIVDYLEDEKYVEAGEVENRLRAAAEIRRAIVRMRQEVTVRCSLLPVLLDVVFAFLLWRR